MVIGAVIIKHKLCLSDEETVRQIQENPYLLFFVGLSRYQTEPPFAPSLFIEIRKRMGQTVFEGETRTSRMKRTFGDLAAYLYRELAFPAGAFLLTGTGIVPHESFNLTAGDRVRVAVGDLVLENETTF